MLTSTEPAGRAALDLLRHTSGRRFKTILADPPWRFENSTGKVAPEHKRLSRYGTMNIADIKSLPIEAVGAETASLSLGAQRTSPRWSRGDEGLGIFLQVKRRLA